MDKSAYKNVWVFIEQKGDKIESVSLELCAEGRKIADACGEKLVAVVIGGDTQSTAAIVAENGVDQIVRVDGEEYAYYTTDPYVAAMDTLCKKYNPSAIMIGATVNGRDLAPRLAARLRTGSIADATEISYNPETGNVDWTKPSFGGNLMATIICDKTRPQIGTVRPGTFKKAALKKADVVVTKEEIPYAKKDLRSVLLSFKKDENAADVNVEEAEVIICVGGGLKSMDQIGPFQELADLLGGVIGVTRPLIDKGFYPLRRQIGQSGKSVSPRLYIGFGISGAIQHTAGITSSETIVAVNNNPEAPIFGHADYAIVGDMHEVARELVEAIKAHKKK